MQIIVLGMHRSGTSLTTRLINMMGAYFAPEGMGISGPDNPKGHWERRDVIQLNDALLAAQGCSWHDVERWNPANAPPEPQAQQIYRLILAMDAFRPFVLKDPRLCLTLPAWRPRLEAPIAVIVHRDPVEIALSLQKRNNLPLAQGVALWERYAESLLHVAPDLPKIHVSHQSMLQRPLESCRTLCDALRAHGVRRIELPSDQEILAFVTPELYHSRPKGGEYALSPQQETLAKRLQGG